MTTYDHAMLGACGVLATGLQRRYRWPLVATAAVAAVLPDWDGLSLLFGPAAFDRLHRAAGHSVFVAAIFGALVAALDYRFSLVCRMARWAKHRLPRLDAPAASPIRRHFHRSELALWMAVGAVASLSHLASDLVFSGHATLADWGLKLLWPFSDQAWVFPMVRWGDAIPTILFVLGMFAMVRWPTRLESTARWTLLSVLVYILARGFLLPA